VEQTSKFCQVCHKQTLWGRPATNHILHLLITLFLCGLRIPTSILASIKIGGWRCQSCGNQGGFVGRFLVPLAGVGVLLIALVMVPIIAIGMVGAAASAARKAAPQPQPQVASKPNIGKGYNQGKNDLEGRTDQTPKEPIIAAAKEALRSHLKGQVTIDELAEVRIIEAGKSWFVSGKYQSPVDNRRDYTSIIIRKDGQFAAGNLMLDDDVVMDKILSDGSVAVTPAPPVVTPEPPVLTPTIPEPAKAPEPKARTWTSADGKFTVEAEFGGAIGSKVTLRKTDGSVITLDADKLSDADREWIGKRK